MLLSEKQMKKILGRDIQISDVVNERITETYKKIEADRENSSEKGQRLRRSYTAAAIAVIMCLAIPGGVYAAANLDFFNGMFGNATKKSVPAVTKEVDNQKGRVTSIMFPSKEYVSVDVTEAEHLIGSGAMKEPIEKKLGDHVLRIENLIYDKYSAFMYFTLERKGGVTMLIGNEETNAAKGAYFSDDELYRFSIDTSKEGLCGSNIYVDTEKSTKDKLFCYAYMIWTNENGLAEGEFPILSVFKYPCPPAEMKEEDYDKIKKETTVLTEKEPIPVQKVDTGEKGCLEYSPVSIIVDMSEGFGLTEGEAADPINVSHIEIRYKDGSSYVVSDAEKYIENSSYTLGVGTSYRAAYNRIVNIDQIKEIVVNDVVFPVK